MTGFPPLITLSSPLSQNLPHHQQQQQDLNLTKKTFTEKSSWFWKSKMASTTAVTMAMPLPNASQKRIQSSSETFFKPLPVRPSRALTPAAASRSSGGLEIRASLKEKAVTGLTAAALTASMVIPEVAEAASGVSPSLKNFLLSIAAGGVVLVVIVGAVVGVSNFDPVKRG